MPYYPFLYFLLYAQSIDLSLKTKRIHQCLWVPSHVGISQAQRDHEGVLCIPLNLLYTFISFKILLPPIHHVMLIGPHRSLSQPIRFRCRMISSFAVVFCFNIRYPIDNTPRPVISLWNLFV